MKRSHFSIFVLITILATSLAAVIASSKVYAQTQGVRGINWADDGDNFQSGDVYPAGISSSTTASQAAALATNIAEAVKWSKATTVRLGLNPATVSDSHYWPIYQAMVTAITNSGDYVILGYWPQTADGQIDAGVPAWTSMWQTVNSTFGSNPRVLYELANEPYNIADATLANDYASAISAMGVGFWKCILEQGSSTSLSTIGGDSRLVYQYLGVHMYDSYIPWGSSESQYYAFLSARVAGYGSRTIMTEFGETTNDGTNYLGQPINNGSNHEIAYVQAVTQFTLDNSMGSVDWDVQDSSAGYGWFVSETNLTEQNPSFCNQVRYGWNQYNNLIGDGVYGIINDNSGMCVEDPGYSTTLGMQMQQYTYYPGGYNGQWCLKNLGNNIVTLVNTSNGLAMDDYGGSKTPGDAADQYTLNSGINQQWQVISVGNGLYEFKNVNSGLALDVSGWSKSLNAVIDQYTYLGNPNQQWWLE